MIPSPPAYVAGTITLPAGQVSDLLALIHTQLDPDCSGAGTEVQIIGGTGTIFVGAYSKIGGPLSSNNWGYQLTPGDKRVYRSSYPGNNCLVGDIQVMAATLSQLHVEILF